jgi:hypothetical protein
VPCIAERERKKAEERGAWERRAERRGPRERGEAAETGEWERRAEGSRLGGGGGGGRGAGAQLGSGSVNMGCLPAAQLNVAPSTTRPPMLVPCPPSHLVSEWQTMSAPCLRGWVRYGVENVESTTSGTPLACAMVEMASRSQTSRAGLEQVSQKNARVLSSATCARGP